MRITKAFLRTILLNILLVSFSFYSNDIFSQHLCPLNFDLPEDSDVSDPLCGDIEIDDAIILINADDCSYDIFIELELDIPMSTIVTDDVYFDINVVDENLDFHNMICLDNIIAVGFSGGLVPGEECGVDKSFQFVGDPIALGDVMEGNFIRIRLDRPSEFDQNCFHLVFEFGYTDIVGNQCSYFGDLVLFFQKEQAESTCGSLDYAGVEECEFPTTLGSPLNQLENFANSFQITATSMCGHEEELNPLDILFVGDQLCFQVPPGGCVEVELTHCPGDINAHSCITVADLLEMRKLLLGNILHTTSPFGGLMGDIGEDGVASTLDLVKIQKWILGIIDPESSVGECVIFDPTSEGLAGDELDGLGGWSDFDSPWEIEVCDGDDFEVIMGILGDVNGSCPCDIVEGLLGEDVDELSLLWNEDRCNMLGPDLKFYDLVLDVTGRISAINVAEDWNRDALVEVHERENGYSLMINSKDSKPISLQESISNISFECRGGIRLTNKSFLISASDAKIYSLNLDSRKVERRDNNASEASGKFSMKVMGSTVKVSIGKTIEDVTRLQLFSTDGRLISTKNLNAFDEIADFSNDLNNYAHGSLFVVVAFRNGEQLVEKILW